MTLISMRVKHARTILDPRSLRAAWRALAAMVLASCVSAVSAQSDTAYFAQMTAYSGALYFVKGDVIPVEENQYGAGKPCGSGICSRGHVRASEDGSGVSLGITKSCCIFGIERLAGGASRTGELTFTGPSGDAYLKGAHLDLSGNFTASLLEPGVQANGSVSVSVELAGVTRGSASLSWSGDAGVSLGPRQNIEMAATSGPDAGEWSVLALGNGVNILNGATYTLTYSLGVGLSLQGVTNADVSADFLNTLKFTRSGPVFDLPAGWTAQSVDLSIIDNRFCPPGACVPPVPEPSTLWLCLAGLGAVGSTCRRARRPAATTGVAMVG